MCGIFGYVGPRRNAAELILNGLKELEYRGYDSWGVAVAASERASIDKRVGRIGRARTELPASGCGIGHTRWATHGGVTDANAHPHVDCGGRFAIVHNGIVSNDVELREALAERGHRFRSDTDSELIAHVLEETFEQTRDADDRFVRALMRAFGRLRGLNAVVALDARCGAVAAAKNGSPLVVGLGDAEHFFASDQTALLAHTRRVAFVGDGEAVSLTDGEVRFFDIETGRRRSPDPVLVDWTPASTSLEGHPDYMTKEILEQPEALRNLARASEESVDTLARAVIASDDVCAVGCGSGWHAALAAEYLFARAARRVTAIPGSEFAPRAQFLNRRSLVIALSQSGETADILESVRAARARGAPVIAVTNVRGSSLWRFADWVVPLDVGPERCVVSTKAFSAKLTLIYLCARRLAGEATEARTMVRRAADDVASMLTGPRREAIRAIAETLRDESHLYVIGRGPSFALALETALKIKEVSYLHAEGFAGGELKHGVIALIERGTRCIVVAPDDETYADTMAAALQVKARGATVIGISPRRHAVFDHFIEVAALGDATAIVNAVPAQLLGYDLARLRGHDPDMPRNLAKSVTVK